MNYGIPYQGSKSGIAEWVVSWLPPSHTLVDLFAGGCAVTHAALLSGKFGRVIANDLGDGPQVFRDAANGEFEGYATVPTRGEFHARKDDDAALALLYSFGSDGDSYLWNTKIEDVKLHASRMLSAPSVHERRMEYRAFCRSLARWLSETGDVGKLGKGNGIGELEGLERLERLETPKLDYRDVGIPDGATVYADPPYRRTLHDSRQYGGGFDYGNFEGWLASVAFPVIVSEYDRPAGCVEIASGEKNVTMNDKTTTKATERLFVQERFLGEYERRMSEVGLFAGGES